jgi:Secretion system C-terminal sorting domain/Pregnancy-associated plasma protein-A
MNKLLLTFLSILTISFSYAQKAGHDESGCGSDAAMEQMYKSHPELLEKQKQFERLYQTAVMKKMQEPSWRSSTADIVTIPVVVHVVHLPGTPIGIDENISDAQIQAGMLHLNQAFRRDAMSAFNGIGSNPNVVGADIELNFCLAKRDPNGNPTNGIQRIASNFSYGSFIYYDNFINPNYWDTGQYLNIWLVACFNDGTPCVRNGSYLGISFGVQPSFSHDGIISLASYFGSSTAASTIHIHEVGHYFGLGHSFTSSDCTNNNCLTDGDRVCDTPPCGPTPGTPGVSCGTIKNTCTTDSDDSNVRNPYRSIALGGLGDQSDNYENYMDYHNANCRNTFTEGQKTRMRFVLDNQRASLKSSMGCVPSTAAPIAFFPYPSKSSFNEKDVTTNINCLKYEDIDVPIGIINTSASVTINILIGAGTATNMVDFQLLTPSITIAAGAISGNAILRIFNDSDAESLETIILNISSTNSGVTPSNIPFIFTIINDDNPLPVPQKTWTGAVDAMWGNAGNWSPSGVPSCTDAVLFNNGASNTVSLAASTAVGQLKVSNNTILNLKSTVTASINLTIKGWLGDDLIVGAGATLNLTAASNVEDEQIIQIVVPTTVTASILGNMGFSNTGTSTVSHRLLASDVGSVVFQSGSVFTANVGFGGYAFGTAIVPPFTVKFANGSRYISKSGSTPLGDYGDEYNSVAFFEQGSTYQHDQTALPSLVGRRYSNFEYTKIMENNTILKFLIDGDLTIKNGSNVTLNVIGGSNSVSDYSTIGPLGLKGNLIIENGGNLTLGTGSNNTSFVTTGNIIVRNGGTLTIGTGTSVNLIVLSRSLVVENSGSLILGTGTNSLFLGGGYDDQLSGISNSSTTSFGTFSKLYLKNRTYLYSNFEIKDLEFVLTPQYPTKECTFWLFNYDLRVTGSITNANSYYRRIMTNGTGKLKISNVGATPVVFPVSKSYYGAFVTLSNLGTPDEFSVNVGLFNTINPSFNSTNVWDRVWNIEEATPGGSNVTMTLHPQNPTYFVPSSTVVLGHGNPDGTFNPLPATYVPDAFGGTLTASGVTTFSPFIIANDVALGVTLTNFNGHLTNKNTVLLNWQTENEKDNSGFEIQRSSDAKDWSNIGFVKGKGQSSVAFDYTFEDKGPLSILTYYRLKQVDFDGKATYSKVINVLAKKNNSQFTIFPNPTKGKTTTLELNEDMVDGTLTVTNAIGSIVKKQTINSKTLTLDLSTLTNGVYIFDIQKGANRYFEKVMVAE